MTDFTTVAKVGEIAEGKAKVVHVNDRAVAVFLHEGKYHAVDDYCPHQGMSLGAGSIYKGCVVCPWHAWRFAIDSGVYIDNPRVKLDVFAVEVVGDEIRVSVPPAPPKIPGWKR